MYRYHAELVRVIDGDTVDLFVDLGFHAHVQIRCRLAGINTPELHGDAKAAGEAAAQRLLALLNLNPFTVETRKTGKFGRWLATLYDQEGRSINQQLIDEGHAVPYPS